MSFEDFNNHPIEWNDHEDIVCTKSLVTISVKARFTAYDLRTY